jgi:hypothetical protein
VNCSRVAYGNAVLKSGNNIQISVAAGYAIYEVKFRVYEVYQPYFITATNGTTPNLYPSGGNTYTVSHVDNAQTVLQSVNGNYEINYIEVTYNQTYTVSYNANGGTGAPSSQTKLFNVNVTLHDKGSLSRTGYTAVGWAETPQGQYQWPFGYSYSNDYDLYLYARWTANTYTVTFNKQSGSGGSNSVTATYDSAMPSATMPTRTGYTFGGYYDQTNGAGTQYYNASGGSVRSWNKASNTTLYAKWTAITYTIKFNNYDGTQLQSSQVNYGATPAYTGATPTKPSTAAYTYTFNGWSPAIATATGNATYTAQFTEQINQATVDAAIALINAIDDPVVYTTACHGEITDARTAYEALTAEQKALVDATTLQKLTDAEAAYAALEADHNAANAVIDLINAIDNPVVYTDACHQEILAAREAYDNLTQAQKDLIDASTLQKLTDAEAAYAALNVDITPNVDPQNASVYYSTFYDGSRQLQLPANVEAFIVTAVSGDAMQLQNIAVAGQTIPADAGVILKSTVASFTLTPSEAEAVSAEGNILLGVDGATPVSDVIEAGHTCYVLSGHSTDNSVTGLGFYIYEGENIPAHKAYINWAGGSGSNQAPRRMRFVFETEQTATGVENVQGNVQSTKVIENGVLYIIKNGVRYNAQGQMVK